MEPGHAAAAGGPEPLEAAIARRARDFDPPALLELLRARFPERAIRFRGHPSLAPQPTVVRAVEFAADHVVVTLNLGLFASTSPLPSYFHDLLAQPRGGPALEGVLALLDDRLLRDRAEGLRPERTERFVPRAVEVRRSALAIARPASLITLHWILSRVFPELGVSVRRAPVRRGMAAGDPRLGTAILGDAALGGEAEVRTPGMDGILWAEESTTWDGEPWWVEARLRLHAHVLPALRDTAAHLRLALVDLEGKGRLEVEAPAPPGASWLGYDPLVEGPPPRVFLLFEGRVPGS